MSWWMKNNLRMIQNNLRDIDAAMDIDKHIEWLKSFDVNVLQIGCGGITAFHPTKLDCQYVNPYMNGDFMEEIVDKCHANGIRVIARFDFSKTHESFYENHAEWYSRRADGSPIRYNDTVATCVNGEYQRKLSLKIIEEVLRKYPVDGIFFNAFGYLTQDYSGNYIGICQCENCRRRFWEMYGKELPVKEDIEDPDYIKYLEFKKLTVNEILDSIHKLTRSISPEIAVSTYATHGIDIVRNESNSALDRPLPFWIYNSSDNVGLIEDGFDDKISSNCAINAVDIPYRFMGVSKYLNQMRLYGCMAGGSGLDWCIIGGFEDYPDYENMESTREVFRFHKQYEEYYGHFDHRTRIMLVFNGDRKHVNKEYRGLFRMMKEEHVMFTIMDTEALENRAGELDDYDFILLPDVPAVGSSAAKALKKTTACIIASGCALEQEKEFVKDIFGIKLGEKVTDIRGTYLRTEPKTIFRSFANQQWVFLDGPYCEITLGVGTQGVLPKVEKTMFGPPERCYGHQDTEEWMAAFGNGNIYIPWGIASLYYQYGYDEFKRMLLNLMESVKPIPRPLETNAPEMVEIFWSKCDESTYMLQMINMTGFNGTTFFEPLRVEDITVKLNGISPQYVKELTETGLKNLDNKAEISVTIPTGKVYKAFLVGVDCTVSAVE